MAVQWVQLRAGDTLVASQERAWIQRPQLGALALDRPMPAAHPGTTASVGHLLDGAIAAAERAAIQRRQPPLSATRWAWDLLNQWYIADRSVALLRQSVERYRELGRADLAQFASLRLEGEEGHDRFPLDDLRALGYDPEALTAAVAPEPVAIELIEFAASCLRGDRAAAFLGYIHAMERHAIRVPPAWFDVLAQVLPPGVDAASGLRAHATELDLEHVDEAVAFFAGLPATDRTAIAWACFRTAEIRCAAGPVASETELEARLAPFRPQARGALT